MTNPIENQANRILDHVAGKPKRGDRVLVEAVVSEAGRESVLIDLEECVLWVEPERVHPLPPAVRVARDSSPAVRVVHLSREQPHFDVKGRLDYPDGAEIHAIGISTFEYIHGPDALPAPGTCHKMRMFALDAEGE